MFIKYSLLSLFFLIFFIKPEYQFDYKLKYEITIFKDSIKSEINYFINSKNNNYIVTYDILKNNIPNFHFRNTTDSITIISKTKINIENPGKIVAPKNIVNLYKSRKYLMNNYNFHEMRDTILNGKSYKRILLKSIDSKREKRKKIGSEVYIVDTEKDIKPIFVYVTALDMYNYGKKFPNGLLIEKHYYNYEGKLEKSEKLTEFSKTNLTVEIQE